MATTKSTEKCAHPSCTCAPAKDSKFCSAFCEGASDKPDIMCGCGHAGCTARESVSMAGGGMGRTNY